ncbi:glycosyltransferase family 2 protein [Peribacillus frigoritolerans]|uniref:glycosyltransferase family 2 protein n=1 Tax=Peribacillus frigoritolerans TaxID=450367 RepID=UPI00105AAB5C|nr:glycosyltransferase [Peribacillus frigoritolerans]TDL78991.1 glycosyltransferase [Peribacillus frigoritolerans]
MNTTRVTVLMPVYNGEKHLFEAIESILNQTYKEFELLIINDGSTDKSEDIIKKFKDSRIRYVVNDYNIGLIKTLNKGLGLINSEYIARMDADDISLPTRLEKQIKFMDQNKDIAVSGTSILVFNNKGKVRKEIVSKEPIKIRTQLLFYPALMHPTVLIRKKIIEQGNFEYDEAHKSVEDFGLWQKMSVNYKLSNIPEILLKYRINESGITQLAKKDIDKQDLMHIEVYKQTFNSLGMKLSEDDLMQYRLFLTGRAFADSNSILAISGFIKSLKKSIENQAFDLDTFNANICRFYRLNSIKRGLNYSETNDIYKEYFESIFKFTLKEKMKFVIKRYFH